MSVLVRVEFDRPQAEKGEVKTEEEARLRGLDWARCHLQVLFYYYSQA